MMLDSSSHLPESRYFVSVGVSVCPCGCGAAVTQSVHKATWNSLAVYYPANYTDEVLMASAATFSLTTKARARIEICVGKKT